MGTGYEMHGWRKGMRICRASTGEGLPYTGTLLDDGCYSVSASGGSWLFMVHWDFGREDLIYPRDNDVVLEPRKENSK